MKRVVATACAALALGTSLVLTAPLARADGSAPSGGAAQPAEIARMRYRQGVDAYGAGRYRESVDYFLQADNAAPSAALSFNIARAYEKMNDTTAALRWYRDYLRRAADAKDRADVETSVRAFEERLAQKGVQQFTVLSTPPGAVVSVDGKPVGTTPFTAEIPPGPHRLELRKDGFEPASAPLELTAQHAVDVSLSLSPAAAPAPAPPGAPAAGPAAPPPDAPVEAHTKGFPMKTVGWILVGVGGAALGTSLVFEISRHQAETDAKHETTQLGYADKLDSMEGRQTAARIFAVTGAVLAVGGGVLVFLGSKKEASSQPAISAACAPTGCWSTVRGTF